jgi:hypothetical protein
MGAMSIDGDHSVFSVSIGSMLAARRAGIRADSEREREHGRERERGPTQQAAKRIAQIASHGICETERARLVHVVTPPGKPEPRMRSDCEWRFT